MGKYYAQDGYLRYGDPYLMFDEDGKLYLGEPWPESPHVRCVVDAHGQVRRRNELLRCAICRLWWDVYEMSKVGGKSRPSGRGSYCLVCMRAYNVWHRKQPLDARSMAVFRPLYTAGELHAKPPRQQYPDLDATA
jgi:hypothetical protein